MKASFQIILFLLAISNVSMAWDETRYDTVKAEWPNGNQKEFIMRYWHMGNEKGFQLHGQYSTWYENGQLAEEIYYDRNIKMGASINWREDGGRSEEVTIVNGERHGMYIEWHPDRNIKTIGYYKNGRKHGLWTFRRSGGDMHNIDLYTDSVQVYYEDIVAVNLESRTGIEIHDKKSYYNEELELWVEWGRQYSIDWINNYLWFDLGKKKGGLREGKWIRLNNRGELLDINYFKNGELIQLE